MAKAPPSKEFIEIPFKIDTMSDGTHVITYSNIPRLVFNFTPTPTRVAAQDVPDNSFNVGYFNEAWVEKWRIKLEDLESDLNRRMVKVYYGLWPENCAEHQMLKCVSTLFARCETLVLKRAKLSRRLNDMCDQPEGPPTELTRTEFATGFAELKKINKSLPDPIYELYKEFLNLEHICEHPKYEGQHPEVAAFLLDLDRHSNAFREGASDERAKAIDDCAKDLGQKLKMK